MLNQQRMYKKLGKQPSKGRKKYLPFVIDKRIILGGIIFILVSFFINIFPIVFLILFSIANTAILSFKRYFDAPVDPQLCTFASILMTMQYGLTYGLITAFLTRFVSMIYNKKIKIAYFFMISSYMVAALFTEVINSDNVVLLGIIVTIISNIYMVFIRKYVTQYSNFEVISYALSDLIFNSVMFIGFSEITLFFMI
jgi:hypothetical protein